MWQLVGGKAVSLYITALSGQGLDVVLNPNTGRWETVTSFGGYGSIGRTWETGLASYLTVGVVKVTDQEWAPDESFSASGYASGNVFWDAVEGARLGTEFSWGIRENKDGQTGTAARLSFIFYFDF